MNIDTIMNPRTATGKQLTSALLVTMAVAEAIRELGHVPSGSLYASVCGKLDLATYEAIIRSLKGAGLVSEPCHELTWIGPELSPLRRP